jgi:hypothetical protein
VLFGAVIAGLTFTRRSASRVEARFLAYAAAGIAEIEDLLSRQPAEED